MIKTCNQQLLFWSWTIRTNFSNKMPNNNIENFKKKNWNAFIVQALMKKKKSLSTRRLKDIFALNLSSVRQFDRLVELRLNIKYCQWIHFVHFPTHVTPLYYAWEKWSSQFSLYNFLLCVNFISFLFCFCFIFFFLFAFFSVFGNSILQRQLRNGSWMRFMLVGINQIKP